MTEFLFLVEPFLKVSIVQVILFKGSEATNDLAQVWTFPTWIHDTYKVHIFHHYCCNKTRYEVLAISWRENKDCLLFYEGESFHQVVRT